jgi:hypothetical protein
MMKEEQLNGDCPSRRRRKAEILCHNVHVICASTMGSREGTSGKSARADGVREHYAKADHVQWRRERTRKLKAVSPGNPITLPARFATDENYVTGGGTLIARYNFHLRVDT